MQGPKPFLFAALLGIAGLVQPMAALAQEDPLKWLPPGSRIEMTLSEHPARAIISEQQGGTPGYLARLGELVFRSPLTLGRDAARRGISCEACHTNGAANTSFTIPGASDQPGNVDLTHKEFHFREDDGKFNPVNIPSLRGVRWTAPYGHDGRFPTLRSFSHNVITREFGGPPLDDWLMDALVAWQMEFGFLDGADPFLPGAAYRANCQSCHGDTRQMPPRRVHDVGTGRWVEAPVLRGLAESAPYLHDGSAATVADAVAAHRDMRLTAAEQAEAIADAQRLGMVTRRFDPETLDGDVARLNGFIDLINQQLLDEDGSRADMVGDMVAMEIGRIYRRFDREAAAARGLIREWAKTVARATRLGLDGEHPAARDRLAELRAAIAGDMAQLQAHAAQSLYAAAQVAPDGGEPENGDRQ
ncbi:MAG: hypothetical protein P1U65_12940 [Minwuia sp.]|nr:hypothetical protein [Minwuia sp.]